VSSGMTRGRRAWAAAGERCRAHRGVDATMRKEREGERRLVGGPAHGRGPILQRNEESGREGDRWARPQI
jgi:hypothetical protein